MSDLFDNHGSELDSPATYLIDITPNDNQDLAVAVRGLNVATTGAVRVTTVNGTTATLFIAAGIAFPIRAERVLATGTTATGIVGLY